MLPPVFQKRSSSVYEDKPWTEVFEVLVVDVACECIVSKVMARCIVLVAVAPDPIGETGDVSVEVELFSFEVSEDTDPDEECGLSPCVVVVVVVMLVVTVNVDTGGVDLPSSVGAVRTGFKAERLLASKLGSETRRLLDEPPGTDEDN